MPYFKDVTTGFLIGLANIIPGVSGGTFALILGVFERIMAALNNISLSMVREFFHCFVSEHKFESLTLFCKKYDLFFLMRIGLGATVALLSLSSLFTYLLANHYASTFAFFFGLILLSIRVPIREIVSFKMVYLIPILIGILSVILLSRSSDPVQKLKNKSRIYQEQVAVSKQTVASPQIDNYDFKLYLFMFLAGVVSISAMILPGLSGSLVLLVLGRYTLILSCVYSLAKLNFTLHQFLILTSFGFGLVVGLLLFSRLLKLILDRYHNVTLAFLGGLVAGSLYPLWPFKKLVELHDIYIKNNGSIELVKTHHVFTNLNILPETGEWVTPLLCFMTGCIVMILFLTKDKKENQDG